MGAERKEQRQEFTFDCKVVRDTFTNKDTGEQFMYYAYYLQLGDESIKLCCTADSKKLANYLLKAYFGE